MAPHSGVAVGHHPLRVAITAVAEPTRGMVGARTVRENTDDPLSHRRVEPRGRVLRETRRRRAQPLESGADVRATTAAVAVVVAEGARHRGGVVLVVDAGTPSLRYATTARRTGIIIYDCISTTSRRGARVLSSPSVKQEKQMF